MNKLKAAVLAAFLVCSASVFAQETEPELEVTSKHRGIVGLSTLMWNQELNIQQNVQREKDVANYNLWILEVQKEYLLHRLGWRIGGFWGQGQANGGGNNPLNYEKSRVALSVYGLSARFFYQLTNRVSLGPSLLVFFKSQTWPKDNPSQVTDGGRDLIVAPLAQMNVRLTTRWDFETSLGPLAENSTLWKIGINFRF